MHPAPRPRKGALLRIGALLATTSLLAACPARRPVTGETPGPTAVEVSLFDRA